MRLISQWLATLALVLLSATVCANDPTMEDIIAVHWLPETKAQARSLSVKAAALRTPSGRPPSDAPREADPMAMATLPVVASHLSDGLFGFWAGADGSARPSNLRRFSWEDVPIDPNDQWPLWQAVVARAVPSIWAETDPATKASLFGPLIERLNAADPFQQAHARAQARRVMRIDNARARTTRETIEGSLLLAEARFQWAKGHVLSSAWLTLEGLMWMVHDQNFANARFYSGWLSELPQASIRSSRAIDINLPVVMGLLIDSANHLSQASPEAELAFAKLSAAYHSLALFMPDGASYLDQPVRDQMETLKARCGPAMSTSMGMDDALIERCIQEITNTLANEIDSEELLGATGPLSVEFLARELGLVSWQRARYLNSYVNAMLGGNCRLADGFNALEWNLGIQWLSSLHQMGVEGLDEVFEVSADELSADYAQWIKENQRWVDCVSTVGEARQDPIERLLKRQLELLQRLDSLVNQANAAFFGSVSQLGADVDLNQPMPQPTDYRPSGLRVRPCDATRACGASVELPVSEAMLSLIPEGYWLADQLKVGDVTFCYDEVKWIDRQMRSVRENDAGVANFSGRLSFTIQADFQKSDQSTELIFKRRLETESRRDFFFGQAVQDNLAMDCPHGLDGRPIQSELSEAASGLVPKRLTYFTSIPTSVSAHLLSQWSQGENWQAQLVDDARVAVITQPDDMAIRTVAESQRLSLVDRRERSMATRLTNLDIASDDDELAATMREIDTLSRLIRRVMELHYAPILRWDDDMRAALAGDQSLLTREDIRSARDQGVLMIQMADVGIERAEVARAAWSKWPSMIRQTGLVPPELQSAQAIINAWKTPSNALPATSQTNP